MKVEPAGGGEVDGAVVAGDSSVAIGVAIDAVTGGQIGDQFDGGEVKEIVLKGDNPIPAGTPVNVVFATDGVQIYPNQAPRY